MARTAGRISSGWKPSNRTPLNTPTDLVVSAGDNFALLRWTDTNEGRAIYEFQREKQQTDGSWGELAEFRTPKGATNHVDQCGPGTFRWRVRAVAQ